MNDVLQDLRFGLRNLGKNPGFTAVALATLAIGIGANAAIFSFIDGVLLRPSPYKDVDRMVRLLEKPPGGGYNSISTLNYLDWEKQSAVFEAIAAQRWGSASLTGIENPVQVPCESVTAQFFNVFKSRVAMGRTFVPGDDQPGHDHVAVLSHAFWTSQYASDPAIVGKTITLDGEPYIVIGVMAAGVFDLTSTRIWRPLAFKPDMLTRDFHWFSAWALLKPGVTVAEARSQMDALAIRIAHDYPKSNKGWGIAIDPFSSILVSRDLERSLFILMGAVGMVLLIGCANLANLTLAKGISREREIAIRSALGAGRGRLVRQLLTESLVVALIGGALGVAVAYFGLEALKATVPPGAIPPNVHVDLDARVLRFILGLSVLTGLFFGIVPALKAARADLTHSIKQGGGGASVGAGSRRFRSALIVAEVAVAFMLLTGAGLLIRSFIKVQQVATGFDDTNVVTASLPISDRQYPTPESFEAYSRRLSEAVRALPGVRDAALTSALPLQGWGWGMHFQIAGTKEVDEANQPACFFKMVSPSYFRSLGIRITRGRTLDEHDGPGSPPVAVINETMAKRFFTDGKPLGKHILVDRIAYDKQQLGPEVPWEVVGVIADEKIQNLESSNDENPGMYVTLDQSPESYVSLVVRGSTNPSLLQRAIVGAIHGVNPNQIVAEMKTLEQIKYESLAGDRFVSTLMSVFSGVALMLAAIGLYSVISYSVEQRTRELGIRAALGADPGSLLGLVIRNGLTLAGVGLAFGLAGALGLCRYLAFMLYGVESYDPVTLALVAAVLAGIAVLASLIPALRAMKVNPVTALRYD